MDIKMKHYAKPLAKLISELSKLPGIGSKSAQRLAFYILSMEDKEAFAIADAISVAKKSLSHCIICGNITDEEKCGICSDTTRNQKIICVVESSRDVYAIERMREFKGLYHVLNGAISPMDGIGPDDINLKQLIIRLQQNDEVEEIIMATNPTIEGEATAMYTSRLIKPTGIKVTRIAHGVPVGGDLEFTDEITLSKAMEGRRVL